MPQNNLFKTVLDIHSRGNSKLSTNERRKIEQETADLIHKSMMNRRADRSSVELDGVVDKLKDSDADDSYKTVVDFLKENGVISDDKDSDSVDRRLEELEKKVDKLLAEEEEEETEEEPEGEEEEEEEEEDDDKEGDADMKKVDKKGDKDTEKKTDKKKEPRFKRFNDKEDEFDAIFKQKDAVLKMAKDLDRMRVRKDDIDLGDLQEEKKLDSKEDTSEEMGIEKDTLITASKKYKVAVTSEKNVVAYHVEDGPIFFVKVPEEIKKDSAESRRFATKVFGTIVYDGVEAAIEKFSAKRIGKLAGADENIQTTGGDVPENTKSVDDDGIEVTEEKHDKAEESVLDNIEVTTEEKPRDIRPIARYKEIEKQAKDSVLDNADDTAEVEVHTADPDHLSSTEGADDTAEEDPDKIPGSILEGIEENDNIRNAMRALRSIYASRAKQAVSKANEDFVRKFIRCAKIASRRMLLNHDAHPLKIAVADVLISDNIEFTDGLNYNPMDKKTAVELTELMFNEGQEKFVDSLLERVASLMKKSDGYIKDAEDDLNNVVATPVDPGSETNSSAMDISSEIEKKSSALKREATKGNFEFNRTSATGSEKRISVSESIREALSGSTRLGRMIG